MSATGYTGGTERVAMNNIEILTCALEFIEENLQNEIKTQDVADACYCSKSALEKIFRHISRLSIREYLVKRRMTIAARMLAADKDARVLDIALACGYSTNESFTRAFKEIWNCNPSDFKSRKDIFELFPKLCPPIQNGGTYMQERRHVDISEMYDLFVQRKNCYFICCDIHSLIPINEISYKAGDLAIRESLNRMERAAGDDDIVFRIGGDEFVMLTASEDIAYADAVCEKIRACNGQPILFEGREIPLHLYVGCVKFEGSALRYRDLYEQLHQNIIESKK